MNAHFSTFHRPSRRALATGYFSAAALMLALVSPGALSASEPGSASDRAKAPERQYEAYDSGKRVGIEKVEVYPQTEKIRIEPDYPYDRAVDIEIWTHKGDNARYCVGEPIEVFFRTNVDAYVAIYNTDTLGRTQRLFPNRYDHDNFVEGGRTYRLPARGYDFIIEGPRGRESLKAVAALDRRDLHLSRRAPASHHYRDRRDHSRRYGSKVVVERIGVYPTESPDIDVDTITHRVRDGYRCERRYPRTRPWWK